MQVIMTHLEHAVNIIVTKLRCSSGDVIQLWPRKYILVHGYLEDLNDHVRDYTCRRTIIVTMLDLKVTKQLAMTVSSLLHYTAHFLLLTLSDCCSYLSLGYMCITHSMVVC